MINPKITFMHPPRPARPNIASKTPSAANARRIIKSHLRSSLAAPVSPIQHSLCPHVGLCSHNCCPIVRKRTGVKVNTGEIVALSHVVPIVA